MARGRRGRPFDEPTTPVGLARYDAAPSGAGPVVPTMVWRRTSALDGWGSVCYILQGTGLAAVAFQVREGRNVGIGLTRETGQAEVRSNGPVPRKHNLNVIKKSHLLYVACVVLFVVAVLFPPYKGVVWTSIPRHFFEGWHFISFGFNQPWLGRTTYFVLWPLLIAEIAGILAVAICVAVFTRRRTVEPSDRSDAATPSEGEGRKE